MTSLNVLNNRNGAQRYSKLKHDIIPTNLIIVYNRKNVPETPQETVSTTWHDVHWTVVRQNPQEIHLNLANVER